MEEKKRKNRKNTKSGNCHFVIVDDVVVTL